MVSVSLFTLSFVLNELDSTKYGVLQHKMLLTTYNHKMYDLMLVRLLLEPLSALMNSLVEESIGMVPCQVGFKLHLCLPQLTNLVSCAPWGLWGNLECRNTTTDNCEAAHWVCGSSVSTTICWSWMLRRNRQQKNCCEEVWFFSQWTKKRNRKSGPLPSCHGGVKCKKSEFLQVVFL